MKSKAVISLINVLAAVLGALALANTYPSLTGFFGMASGLLGGIVNVNKPGTAAKIEAARQEIPQ